MQKEGLDVFQSSEPSEKNYISPTLISINKISDMSSEQFGPILHILKYASNDIDKLINDINNTGYGLTMGIHSRIESQAGSSWQKF